MKRCPAAGGSRALSDGLGNACAIARQYFIFIRPNPCGPNVHSARIAGPTDPADVPVDLVGPSGLGCHDPLAALTLLLSLTLLTLTLLTLLARRAIHVVVSHGNFLVGWVKFGPRS